MEKTALLSAGTIFLIISLLHGLRLFLKIVIVMNGFIVPQEVSGIGAVIAFALALWMFQSAKNLKS